MIDHLKYFAKLSGIALWSFVKIFAVGYISVVISFVIGCIILLVNRMVGAPHGSGAEFFPVLLFITSPVQCILLTLILFSSFLIFFFAGRYTLRKIIHRIIRDKAESVLYPALDKVLLRVNATPDSMIRKGMDYSLVKLKLIHSIKNETENKWTKRVLIYGFKKINLHDVDFNEENIDTNELIKRKTIQALQSVTEPSKTLFWCIVGFHWLSVIVIAFMR